MTEAEAIAQMAKEAAARVQIFPSEDGREFVLYPKDYALQDISHPNAQKAVLPETVFQRAEIQTAASLIAYVNRYKTDATAIFADVLCDCISGVLDYHGAAEGGAVASPNYAAHRGVYGLARSQEWKTWTEIDGRLMDQIAFARFLEENGADIYAPSGADVLEACRDLQAVRKVNFKRAVRTASGNESFSYSDETEARTAGEIELPTKFELRIPVYFGEPPVSLFAFLRWHLDDGVLKLGVKLHRAEYVRQAAFLAIVDKIATATGVATFIGKQPHELES